jgi:uncharacterized membrane protein YecN with MAPEG domain
MLAMSLATTPTYAAILTLFFVFLSARVIAGRRSRSIGLGDGGSDDLLRRIRAHGNFAEYAPLALLLMALAEIQGSSAWSLHLIGCLLIVGRLSHAYGVSAGVGMARVTGMAMTFAALITGALANLGLSSLAARLLL